MNERCEAHWPEPDSIRVHFCGKPKDGHETHKCRACGVTIKDKEIK